MGRLEPEEVTEGLFREICMKLVEAETERDVEAVLGEYDTFGNVANWKCYGGRDNNEGLILNQQSDATGALVEKLINSMDAVLTKACRLNGLDPRSESAPRSMAEAVEMFFGVPRGDLRRLHSRQRRELAENIYLVASGQRKTPSLAVVDQGEGQRPEDFSETFLALLGSHKRRIRFVQGKYHMGGSGALGYSGRKNYQLIVSRRHPELTNSPSPWGFTLVRLAPTADKTWSYQYYSPGGRIPRFIADSLPLLPGDGSPRSRPLVSGTYIKLYEYDLQQKSMVQTHLFRTLNLRLFTVPLPMVVYEGRNYNTAAPWVILDGMRVRLDGADAVAEGFPIHWDNVKIAEGNYVRITAWLLKEDVDISRQEWIRPDSAVCMTINGQTHARLHKRFFERKSVRKDYLKDYLLVEVDCSNLKSDFLRRVFMPSRDRLRETEEREALENELSRLLREDERLKLENERRRQRRVSQKLTQSSEYHRIVRQLLDASPELARLLGGHGSLANPYRRSERGDTTPFVGRRFPTFLTLIKPASAKVEVPRNRLRRVVFETDAQNDYLTRAHEPGTLTISHPDWVSNSSLRDGYLTVRLEPPESADVGDTIEFTVHLSSPAVAQGLSGAFEVRVTEPEPERKHPSGKSSRPRIPRVAMPNIIPIDRSEWRAGWNSRTVAEVFLSDKSAEVYVNMANIHLLRFLQDAGSRGRENAAKAAFQYGIGVLALAMYTQFRELDVDTEEIWEKVMDGAAMVWTPLLLHFSSEISAA